LLFLPDKSLLNHNQENSSHRWIVPHERRLLTEWRQSAVLPTIKKCHCAILRTFTQVVCPCFLCVCVVLWRHGPCDGPIARSMSPTNCLSIRFILSEVSSQLEEAKRSNPWDGRGEWGGLCVKTLRYCRLVYFLQVCCR
jgi:hypothetical protein